MVELLVQYPSGKDADEQAAEGQEHHGGEVVEYGKDIAIEQGDATEWTEREGTEGAKHEDGEGDKGGGLLACLLELF